MANRHTWTSTTITTFRLQIPAPLGTIINMGDSSSHNARDAAASAPSIASRHEAQRASGYKIEGLTRQEAAAQWNAHALPCLLPTEILEDVFELWREIEPISRTWILEMHKWKVHLGWLSATVVCQHFRAVALGHTALWSTLNKETPWELFLGRSRNSLLCVDTKGVMEPEYLPSVLANLGRIRELYLSETSADGAAEIFKRDAPHMRFLYVRGHSGTKYTLDDDFLLNRSPSLRSLRLRGNVEMPWGISSPLPLRCLSLRMSHKSSKYSFRDLLSCLRNLPLLEKLEIYCSLPEGGDVGNATISLPHLKYLSLYEYDASPLFLWSSITLSAFHCVEVTLEKWTSAT
ncbi:hypothetical protein PENSPDRAFT_193842 [Peniophora sp. CONT]|nr:hypothetical protein PENSPDRAFT_193842 [Peniophora sp. CONT]